jgi:hypothetical protein
MGMDSVLASFRRSFSPVLGVGLHALETELRLLFSSRLASDGVRERRPSGVGTTLPESPSVGRALDARLKAGRTLWEGDAGGLEDIRMASVSADAKVDLVLLALGEDSELAIVQGLVLESDNGAWAFLEVVLDFVGCLQGLESGSGLKEVLMEDVGEC